MEGGWPDPVAAAFCPADRPPIFTALEQQFGLSTFRRKNAFQLLRNTQVLAAESRLDGWVARSSGAASGGPCASKEHAHDLAAPRGFAGVPQSFGAARRGPCAFEYRSLTVAARDQVLCYQRSLLGRGRTQAVAGTAFALFAPESNQSPFTFNRSWAAVSARRYPRGREGPPQMTHGGHLRGRPRVCTDRSA